MCVVCIKRGPIELAIVVESKVYIIFVLFFFILVYNDVTVCFWLFDCTNLLWAFVRPISSRRNTFRRCWVCVVRQNRRLPRTSAFESSAKRKTPFWNFLNGVLNYCNRLSANRVSRFLYKPILVESQKLPMFINKKKYYWEKRLYIYAYILSFFF